ncbi:MAG: radical SAM protein [Bacillota bacterium]
MANPCKSTTPAGLHQTRQGIGPLLRSALWLWGRSGPRRLLFFLRNGRRLWSANRRRLRQMKQLDISLPTVLAISPTMRCNYNCRGCYSRGRPLEDELSGRELDALFHEAEQLGIPVVVVTGGEPLLHPDLLQLISERRHLFFVMITNGTMVTQEVAQQVARSGNIVLLVSIEGSPADTDGRRRPGAYTAVMDAFANLRAAGAFFGFAATNSTANTAYLGSDAFIEKMIDCGCGVGFFSEYVPCGPNVHPDWVLGEMQRDAFRRRVLELRRAKPLVLIQFPQDEYGEDNYCSAAGRASLHINSQGGIEPCPFIAVACENIREGGLLAACRSPFLQAIREQPELLRRKRFACALFEHLTEIETIADRLKCGTGTL